jgi:hypothetical protein
LRGHEKSGLAAAFFVSGRNQKSSNGVKWIALGAYIGCMSSPLMNRRSLVLGGLAMPLAGLAGEPSWNDLVQISGDYTANCMRDLESRHHFSDIERWDMDADTGVITFSTAGRPILLIRFQYVGSFSKMSRTWLWSWANDSMPPLLSREMERVREYGARRRFSKLTKEQWAGQERDGWEMAAVANYLLKGKGVYRPPGKFGVAFVVFTDVRRAA